MAQNLARAPRYVKHLLGRPDEGMFRQYYDEVHSRAQIRPYDDGHLKVLAALLLSAYPDTSFKPSDNIHDLVAVTNFVKFSFFREKDGKLLDANPPLGIYKAMWEYFCRYEVEMLRPDIIVGVGNDVANALAAHLERARNSSVLVKVAFPGRLNLNSRFVPKGERLIRTNNYDPAPLKREMREQLVGTPDYKQLICKAIDTDWHYFAEMKKPLKECVAILN